MVNDTAARGGKLVIPAFAIGRVEEVLYWLRKLEEEKRIPELPVYLDSPMAAQARQQYATRLDELDPEIRAMAAPSSAHSRARAERGLCAFCTARFRVVSSRQESQQLVASRTPAIVISSSGMATGGRVLHHLRAALPDARHTVLFVGYQAAGTRGRQLLEGAETVKIHGRQVQVAARIERIDSMSAHADAGEIMQWLRGFARAPRITYLVHGEPPAQAALKARVERELGWRVHVPEYLEQVQL
jgi:metallo-beta-lactamase family protein